MLSRRIHAAMLVAAGLAMAAGCAQNPVTGRQDFVMMSESQEVAAGRQADQDVRKQYAAYDLPELQRYVEQVGQKLARVSHRPNLQYHFLVVDSPEINAFALPGGYIYVTRGIITYLNSEAELAGVLGHEIGHVTARHSVQQYSAATAASVGIGIASVLFPELRQVGADNLLNALGGVLLSGYGREHELEADRLGAEYLARAGYDPQAMIEVVGVLKNQELFDAEVAKEEGREPRRYHGLFATHPDNDTRLQQVVAEAGKLAVKGHPDERRRDFIDHSDGIIFGDDPRQGVVRGDTFFHEKLGMALNFPPKWSIRNLPDRVQAIAPSGDAALTLRLQPRPSAEPAEFLRSQLRLGAGGQLRSLSINGQPGALALASRNGNPLRVATVYLGKNAFVFLGQAKSPAGFNRSLDAMDRAITSFRPLREEDHKAARALVVRTIYAAQGMTYAQLARQSPLGRHAEGYLRLINGQYPKGEPVPGQVIKVVE